MKRDVNRFFVRRQSSRGGFDKFIVLERRQGRRASRVTTHPHLTKQAAQAEADELNISALVRPYEDDPRPYETRLNEARSRWARR